MRIGNTILIQEQFFQGFGQNGYPTNEDWKKALDAFLPQLYNYGYNYTINGNALTITNLTSIPKYNDEVLTLNVGINIDINCS